MLQEKLLQRKGRGEPEWTQNSKIQKKGLACVTISILSSFLLFSGLCQVKRGLKYFSPLMLKGKLIGLYEILRVKGLHEMELTFCGYGTATHVP